MRRSDPWTAFGRWQPSGGLLNGAPVAGRIMMICAVVFLVQRIMARTPDFDKLLLLTFGLSRHMLFTRGFFWQPVSYMFLHGNFLHLLLNLLVLLFFGVGLEREIGSRRFFAVFLVSGMIGGAGWLLLSGSHQGVCIGASGGVFGLIGAYAGLFPRRDVTLLLFFVIPVTLQAWVLALLLGMANLLDLLFGSQANIAHAAHLAGGIGGVLYARYWRMSDGNSRMPRRGRWWGRSTARDRLAVLFAPLDDEGSVPEPTLDQILEKINRSGLGSLLPAERAVLHRHARRGLAGHDERDDSF